MPRTTATPRECHALPRAPPGRPLLSSSNTHLCPTAKPGGIGQGNDNHRAPPRTKRERINDGRRVKGMHSHYCKSIPSHERTSIFAEGVRVFRWFILIALREGSTDQDDELAPPRPLPVRDRMRRDTRNLADGVTGWQPAPRDRPPPAWRCRCGQAMPQSCRRGP
jgi:hypothetical protein